MIIKKLNATFGNLKNAVLELKDGLNIVEAPNESGKSTWCAFIRVMLYGINTSDRDRIGHISDKNKYMPWSGGNMEGTMELEYGGKNITLERTAQSGVQMKKLTAIYTDTGGLVSDLYSDTAGEILTGVPENVFERTAFIRQDGIKLNQTAELEKRIASIVSTGDEHTSYTETDERLRKWLRRRRHNKTGEIPKMEQELAAVSDTICELEKLNDKLAILRAEEEKYKKLKERYEADLEAHKRLKEWTEKTRIVNTEKKLEEEKAKLKELKERAVINGKAITEEDIQEIRNEYTVLKYRKEDADKSSSGINEEKAEYEKLKKKKEESPFDKMNLEDIQLKVADIKAGEQTLQEKRKLTVLKYVLSLILVGMGLVGGILCSGALTYLIQGIIISGVLAACGLAIFIASFAKSYQAKHTVEKSLHDIGFATVDELIEAAAEYKKLYDDTELFKARVCAAEKNTEFALDTVSKLETEIIEKAKHLDSTVTKLVDVLGAIENADNLLKSIESEEIEVQRLSSIYSTLMENRNGEKIKFIGELPKKPVRDEAATKAELKKVQAIFSDTVEAINLTLGELRAKGDPAVLSSRKKWLEDELAKCREEYDALSLAIEVLEEANMEMQEKFSPRVSQCAGEYLKDMTSGRYEKLLFDKNFDALAKIKDDPVSHGILAMSGGTSDQIYLSLRLAMCELLLSGDEPCPIILDDAFVNFDNERMIKALELIIKISEKRQVIIFTCQDREGKSLRGKDINLIKL
jgi:uncharacterized protein YhaN